MSIQAKRLAQAALGATPAPLYTANAGVALLKDINVSNSGIVASRVFFFIVPAGRQPGQENVFFPGIEVQPGGLAGWNGTQVLEEGDTLYAYGTEPGLTFTASGAVLA